MNQLVICLNGIDKRVLKKNINGVLIAKTDQIEIEEKYTFLQGPGDIMHMFPWAWPGEH